MRAIRLALARRALKDEALRADRTNVGSSAASFTEFLRARGLISGADAAEVERRVRRSHRWLGDVLVAQGALKASQVATIRGHQRRAPGTRFGAVALQLGLISVAQLEAALEQQRRTRAHPVRVVLAMDLVDEDAMQAALLDYADELGAC